MSFPLVAHNGIRCLSGDMCYSCELCGAYCACVDYARSGGMRCAECAQYVTILDALGSITVPILSTSALHTRDESSLYAECVCGMRFSTFPELELHEIGYDI